MDILGCVLTQLHPCSLKHSPPARKDSSFQDLSPTYFFFKYVFIYLAVSGLKCYTQNLLLLLFNCSTLV